MARRRALAPLLWSALLLAGCLGGEQATPPREPVWVGPPPEGGGFAACASSQAREMSVPGLRAEATNDSLGLGPGVHRLDDRRVLWIWADYEDTLRQDRVTRVNPVTVHREPEGGTVVCTRVEMVGEVFVDGTERTYAVGAIYTAPDGWPEGATRFVVNWVIGCQGCNEPRRGNATGTW